MSLDTDVLIIGAGMSGLGLAIQLQKAFPQAGYEIIEKSDNLGGTWWSNTYPGCGCDVPSHFYSFSFAPNPDWTETYSSQPEILAYFRSVAEQHDIPRHITYHSVVQSAAFDEITGTWLVTILDQKTNRTRQRRSKVLVSAVGALSIPNECEIQGAEKFQGKLFHSAEWDHTFNWADKDVVVLGNGCSATQFVPVMTDGKERARKLTQFSRQPHWIAERANPPYSPFMRWVFRYVPLAMRLHRFWIFYLMESSLLEFGLHSTGLKLRQDLFTTRLEYLRKHAPEKYHDVLTPKIEIGCKRKVLDTDYLACLHRENMELVSSDPIKEITETGVRTESGRDINADAIVLATGFQTQKVLHPMEIKGEKGITLNEHWDNFAGGTPQVYFGTCVSQFPNFFIMMGPNTATGHLSVIYTTECQINFTLRAIRPVLQSLYPSGFQSLNPFSGRTPDTVAVIPEAEQKDNDWVQSSAKKFVWSTGCTNWYVDSETGKNTMLYPDWQWKFWLRSIFVPFRSDFVFRSSPVRVLGKNHEKKKSHLNTALVASGLGLALAAGFVARVDYDLDTERVKDIGVRSSEELTALVRNSVGGLLVAKQ